MAGLKFANPLGLAAGWDKNAQVVPLLCQMGLGAVEVGSISASPSTGNPRPRLWRLPSDEALLVNYGLPNHGAQAISRRLRRQRPFSRQGTLIGFNVVNTNYGAAAAPTSPAALVQDYVDSLTQLAPYADFLTLNLSCPNSPSGEGFFDQPGNIACLLTELQRLNLEQPVFLKVAPTDHVDQIDQLVAAVEPFEMVRGFHLNLSARHRKHVHLSNSDRHTKDAGVIAGRPIADVMNQCIATLYRRLPPGRFAIVASGGVSSAEDAYRKICLGASLIQLYSGLVFHGPRLIHTINEGLLRLLADDGFRHLTQAVGCRNRP